MAILLVERGSNKGERLDIKSFPITMGRDSKCDIVIDDDEASRNHLTIKKRGRLYIVQDLDSKNGTYLNGERVLNAIIKSGDKLLIGTTQYQFMTQQTSIEFSNEITDFNMVIGEELGLKAPIPINNKDYKGEDSNSQKIKRIRLLKEDTVHKEYNSDIFEFLRDLQVVFQFDQAAGILFKYLKKLLPAIDRAAIFNWSSASNLLVPKYIQHFSKQKNDFLLSKRTLEDVINRRRGIILEQENPNVTQSGVHRLVLPMSYDEEPICVIHLESHEKALPFPNEKVNQAQLMIQACAATFEAIILRAELNSWAVGMLETLIATIEAKDTYTHGHSERVARYSLAIADQLKLDRKTRRLLLASALCHDIGKIGIHDSILKKATLLSTDEYEEMKLHPTIGADIVTHLPESQRFISGVKYHHEKWDGTGYPEGLIGDEIPFFARIVGLADVFDAMVSGRTYSGFVDQSDAIDKLVSEKELFDPDILKAFVKSYETGALTIKTNTQNNKLDDETTIRKNLKS